MCSNVERGCEWRGTVGTVQKHMETCEFTLILCPNWCILDNDEFRQLMRKDLKEHLERDCPNRDYICMYCGKKDTYEYITDTHERKCDKKPIPCRNAECTATIQRQSMKRHFETCDHTEVHCKYMRLGCGKVAKRKDITGHEEEDDKHHLHMALDTVALLEEKSCSLSGEKTLTFKLTEFKKKMENNEKYTSPSFYTSPKGYCLALEIFVNGCGDYKGTHVSVFAKILKGNYDNQLKWPFSGSITVEILNQLEDGEHFEEEIEFKGSNYQVGDWKSFRKFVSHSVLLLKSDNDNRSPLTLLYLSEVFDHLQYVKDDSLYFRVSTNIPTHKPWLEYTAAS